LFPKQTQTNSPFTVLQSTFLLSDIFTVITTKAMRHRGLD